MKIKKNNQSNKKRKYIAKTVRPWREDYFNFALGKTVPVNDTYLERFGLEFVAWAKQQKYETRPLTCLEDFYEYKDIDHQTVSRWRKRNTRLEQCMKHGKVVLGNLRENGVNRKEFAHTIIERNMYLYKPSFDDIDKRWADLKKKEREEEPSETINVYMPDLTAKEQSSDSNDYKLINSVVRRKRKG